MRTAITIAHYHNGREKIIFSTDVPVQDQKAALRQALADRSASKFHPEIAWVRYQELEGDWHGGESRVVAFEKPTKSEK